MLKKILSLTICLSLLGTAAIASAEEVNNNDSSADLQQLSNDKEINITGKTFKYKNAPAKVKREYEENCRSINKTPNDDDEIFISSKNFSNYGIKPGNGVSARDVVNFFVRWNESTGLIQVWEGSRYYCINMNNTYVGYNYIQSGDAVRGLQALLDLYADQDGVQPVGVDGIFGPNTHRLLLNFQDAMDIGSDGIAGPRTWNTLVRYTVP